MRAFCDSVYLGRIEWDLEGARGPRAAAELLWEYVLNSTGPVVDLIDTHGVVFRVDLARDPGDDDVKRLPRSPKTGARA